MIYCLKECSKETEWLRNLLSDVMLWISPSKFLHYDFHVAITRAESKIYNDKYRHIRLRYNVRQVIGNEAI